MAQPNNVALWHQLFLFETFWSYFISAFWIFNEYSGAINHRKAMNICCKISFANRGTIDITCSPHGTVFDEPNGFCGTRTHDLVVGSPMCYQFGHLNPTRVGDMQWYRVLFHCGKVLCWQWGMRSDIWDIANLNISTGAWTLFWQSGRNPIPKHVFVPRNLDMSSTSILGY